MKTMENKSAQELQYQFYRQYMQQSLYLMPNVYPNNWSECDILRITKNGYMYEYEIKLSVADFKNDKTKTIYRASKGHMSKYVLLEDKAYTTKPNYFVYLTYQELGEQLLPLIPQFAGLLTFTTTPFYKWQWLKKAPKLHNTLVQDKLLVELGRKACWRYTELLYRKSNE